MVALTPEITPYRLHFHRRIVREIPELRLWTVLYRDSAWSAWKLPEEPDLNLVKIAEGEFSRHRSRTGGPGSQLRRSAAAIDFLSSHRVGALLCGGYDELPQLRSIRYCNARRVPVLLLADSNIKADNTTGLKRVAKRAILPRIIDRCDALLPCGSLGRDYFLRYGASAERIFYSPYEPDYHQLENLDPAAVEAARQRFGLPTERLRFVVSSRLVPHKRVGLALDAFLRIADALPQWDLVILGDGPEAVPLRDRAAGSPRVIFTGFLGEQDVVTAVYRASHVLVHPSSYEPWALVINEAAAAGMAIVSTDAVGASAELVREGVNGRLVPIDDAQALAEAMRDAAANLQKYRAASSQILAQWRAEADPVQGLRRALAFTGAIAR